MDQLPRPPWMLLIAAGLLLAGLAACTNRANESAVKPNPDRPTFVWIFSDP